ncbi:DUF6458 family protein [Phytomonospora sp. NPDC050363]|uniref:DUF6458 family protein n=1 Tax=Phytomonospora sp. NPDC050363 TaxID=3155642 RepID=UPI0033D6817C
MGLGAAVFLIVLGAILTFALDWQLAGIDLDVVGWIFMLAGVVWAAFIVYGWNRRRAARPADVVEEHRYPRTVVEERVVRDDPNRAAAPRPLDERDRPDYR